MFKPENTSESTIADNITYIQYKNENNELKVAEVFVTEVGCGYVEFCLREKESSNAFTFYKDNEDIYRSKDQIVIEVDDDGDEYKIGKEVTNTSLIEAFEIALNNYVKTQEHDENSNYWYDEHCFCEDDDEIPF